MPNLLGEVLNALKESDKTIDDIRWIGFDNGQYKTNWEDFAKISDFDYYGGFGSAKVTIALVIVGDDWWLEREEYDGSERWSFKELPVVKEPTTTLTKHLITLGSYYGEFYEVE